MAVDNLRNLLRGLDKGDDAISFRLILTEMSGGLGQGRLSQTGPGQSMVQDERTGQFE